MLLFQEAGDTTILTEFDGTSDCPLVEIQDVSPAWRKREVRIPLDIDSSTGPFIEYGSETRLLIVFTYGILINPLVRVIVYNKDRRVIDIKSTPLVPAELSIKKGIIYAPFIEVEVPEGGFIGFQGTKIEGLRVLLYEI